MSRISAKVDNLHSKLGKLDRMVASLGTRRDNADFRKGLKREMSAAMNLSKEIMTDFKNAGGDSSLRDSQQRFKTEFDRLTELSKKVAAKDTAVVNAYEETHQSGGQSNSNYGSNQQAQAQDQGIDIQFLQFKEEEINNRHEGILQLERDAGELLDMFQDMQSMVDQQQVGLDMIDSNVANAKENVESGREELEKAEESQLASRKKQCCLLFLVLAVAAVVVVVLLVMN